MLFEEFYENRNDNGMSTVFNQIRIAAILIKPFPRIYNTIRILFDIYNGDFLPSKLVLTDILRLLSCSKGRRVHYYYIGRIIVVPLQQFL